MLHVQDSHIKNKTNYLYVITNCLFTIDLIRTSCKASCLETECSAKDGRENVTKANNADTKYVYRIKAHNDSNSY